MGNKFKFKNEKHRKVTVIKRRNYKQLGMLNDNTAQ